MDKVNEIINNIEIKKNISILYKTLKLTKEEINKIEEEIKIKTASFFKKNTGKGPRDTRVSFIEGIIEIRNYDILTPIEKTLLKNKGNLMLIKYCRELFYKEISEELVDLITKIVGRNVRINKIYMNPIDNTEHIILEV